MKLSEIQKQFVKVLVGLYNEKYRPIKGEMIAEQANLTMGTVRNHMQILKNLKFVTSISGPNGGYIPTSLAYENLGFSKELEKISVYLNNKLSNVSLREIHLLPPDNGILYVIGDIRNFKIGDKINIASQKLIVSGKVLERDDLNNTLLSSLEIAHMQG